MKTEKPKTSASTWFAIIYYSFLAAIPIWIVIGLIASDKNNQLFAPYFLLALPLTCGGAAICFLFYWFSKKWIGIFFAHVFSSILFFAIPLAMYFAKQILKS